MESHLSIIGNHLGCLVTVWRSLPPALRALMHKPEFHSLTMLSALRSWILCEEKKVKDWIGKSSNHLLQSQIWWIENKMPGEILQSLQLNSSSSVLMHVYLPGDHWEKGFSCQRTPTGEGGTLEQQMCFDLRNNNRNKILSFNEIWPDLTWDSHTADVLCFQTCPPKAGNKNLTVTYVFIFVYKCQVSVHIPLPLFENFQSILPKSFCVNLVPTLSLHDDTYHVLQSISPWNQNHQIFLNYSWKQLHMIYWLGSQKYPWMTTMFFHVYFVSWFSCLILIMLTW